MEEKLLREAVSRARKQVKAALHLGMPGTDILLKSLDEYASREGSQLLAEHSIYEPHKQVVKALTEQLLSLIQPDLSKIQEASNQLKHQELGKERRAASSSIFDFITKIDALKVQAQGGELFTEAELSVCRQPDKWVQKNSSITWQGADVMVAFPSLPTEQTRKTVLVTEHALPIMFLLIKLRDAGAEVLNHSNKYFFYGRVTEAMRSAITKQPNPELQDLVLLALDEARCLAAEWSQQNMPSEKDLEIDST